MRLGLMSTAWDTPWFDDQGETPKQEIDLVERLRRTAHLGFDNIDLVMDPMHLNPRDRRLLREASQDLGLPVEAVAFVATALLDLNESVRAHCFQRIKDHVDWICELNGKTVLMPIGQFFWENQVIPSQVVWDWAVEGVRAAGKYAQQLGIRIALVSEPFPQSLLNSVDRIVKFLDDVDHPAVGTAVGTAHFHLLGARPSDVLRFKGRIHHANISDCDGKKHGDLPPGRGVVPLREFVVALGQAGYQDSLSVELEFAPPNEVEGWVRETYGVVAGWLDELSLRTATKLQAPAAR